MLTRVLCRRLLQDEVLLKLPSTARPRKASPPNRPSRPTTSFKASMLGGVSAQPSFADSQFGRANVVDDSPYYVA